MLNRRTLPQGLAFVIATAALFAISACSERGNIAGPARINADPDVASADLVAPVSCTVQVAGGEVDCRNPVASSSEGASRTIVGGQGVYLKLTSSNVSYDTGTEIFQFDVTVQNLLNEAIGTPDGVTPGVNGMRVFFDQGPTATSGTGTVSVANADGTAFFTASNQPYFQYNEVLQHNAVSNAKTWQLGVPTTVNSFNFFVYVETDVQPLLVINEVMANPAGTTLEPTAEWFELYNAGTLSVNLQNLVIADSAPSGRRPYHRILSSVVVPSGGYAVLGESTTTATNGGATVDYSYGLALALANSLDAIKISRVYGTDTLTLDRTQYANGAVAAIDGVSRELVNPALDNSNMDGSNWISASVTAVFGPGGRGTPKAQNSGYVP